MVFWNRFVPWKLMGKVEQKIYQYHDIDGTLNQIHLASILSKIFSSSMICYVLKYIGTFHKKNSWKCIYSHKMIFKILFAQYEMSFSNFNLHIQKFNMPYLCAPQALHYIHSSIRTYTELKIHKEKLWVISYMYYIKYSYSTMMWYILIQSDSKINYLA